MLIVFVLFSAHGIVNHYRVMPSDRGYYILAVQGRRTDHFQSLEDLVEFYQKASSGLASELKYHVTKAACQHKHNGRDWCPLVHS